jgi:RNA polymerase sigma-70 factor, ECF subfamily
MTADPEALLARLSNGDRSAFGPLFELHRERLHRMVHFRLDPRLQGRVDADDVLQEVFIEAEKRLQFWSPEQGPFHVWLRLVVEQTMIDLHRHHLGAKMRNAARERMPAHSQGLSGFFVGKLTSPSAAAMRAELRVQLEQALDSMDEIDREVLVLRHFEELSNKETAEILGIQENAASNRYVRALGRLKGLLQKFQDQV